MKTTTLILLILICLCAVLAEAQTLDGNWRSLAPGGKTVRFTSFQDKLTMRTDAYYSNGAQVIYFFDFQVPTQTPVPTQKVFKGRVRSLDGLYGCVFDEKAELHVTAEGTLKLYFPLLTYHQKIRSVRELDGGFYYERVIDWSDWGWVESVTSFPTERWRVLSTECVIDQRNWIANELVRRP